MWRIVSWMASPLVVLSISGCAVTASYRDIRPACRAPAPLGGKYDPQVPDFWVELRPAADLASVANDLVSRYGIHPRSPLPGGDTVLTVGEMSPETVAALRCDPAVASVNHDEVLKNVTMNPRG